MNIDSIDRWRGAVLGLACGDALGMPFEFADPVPSEPVTEMLPHERLRFGLRRTSATSADESISLPRRFLDGRHIDDSLPGRKPT